MYRDIDIDLLQFSPARPAKALPSSNIDEIEFVREHGVLLPVVVRPIKVKGVTYYEILANEKSWLLAQRANLSKVPVIINDASDSEAKEIVERFLDASLDPLLFAQKIKERLSGSPISISGLAKQYGKGRSALSHLLRLQKLPKEVQTMLRKGRLKPGHVLPLVTLPDKFDQIRLAHKIASENLSAREAERLAREFKGAPKDLTVNKHAPRLKDPDTLRFERIISAALGSYTEITDGRLVIDFGKNIDVLSGIIERLNKPILSCRIEIVDGRLFLDFGNDLDMLDKVLGGLNLNI